MPSNRVKETTTTTGTGDLTLAGAVTNYVTFNTKYGTNKRFPYTITDTTNNVWETGFAYLSASTTLVRDKIVDNSSGGATALTLSAGTKDVQSGLNSHHSGFGGMRGMLNMGTTGIPYCVGASSPGGSTGATTANKMNLMPFHSPCTFLATGVNIKIGTSTAAGSDTFRFGIYEIKDNGSPGKLIASTADVDLSTGSSVKTPSFSASTMLYEGSWYYIGFGMENALVNVLINSTSSSNLTTPLGTEDDSLNYRKIRWCQHNLTGGWTALPDDPAISSTIGATTSIMWMQVIGSIT